MSSFIDNKKENHVKTHLCHKQYSNKLAAPAQIRGADFRKAEDEIPT